MEKAQKRHRSQEGWTPDLWTSGIRGINRVFEVKRGRIECKAVWMSYRGWRDGAVGKGIYCSRKRLKFSFQHRLGCSHHSSL